MLPSYVKLNMKTWIKTYKYVSIFQFIYCSFSDRYLAESDACILFAEKQIIVIIFALNIAFWVRELIELIIRRS